jgi:hypothetical protein
LKDLAVIDHSSASIKVFQNVNGRDFTLASDLAPAGMPCDIAVGDLNGDGLSDIAAVPCDQSVLSLFFNDGAGSFQARVEYSLTGQSPYMVRIVELNGDGRADILVGGRETPDKRLEIFLNNGDGTLTERGASFQSQVMELLTSDFNGDGFQDVAAMELDSLTTQTEIEVMTNDGIGNLTSAGIYPHANGAEWSWAALELNGDSVEEIAALVPTSPRSVMLSMNDGLGHFSAGDTFAPASEPSAPSTLAAGDMNGDGTKDLVVLEAPGTGFTVLFKPKTGALRTTLTATARWMW